MTLALLRLVLFSLITSLTAFTIFFGRILRLPDAFGFWVFGLAIRSVRFTLNIHAIYSGAIPKDQGVIMSNHRSYIDIVLIPSKVPYVIVAKKQVRAWPIIGLAGIALQVIFVDRDSMASRKRTRELIQVRLQNKFSVLIFPEGTTAMGPEILPFKPGIFHTCAMEGISVTPVAIEYKNQEMAWIGDDIFLPHFFRAFSRWRVEVAVQFGTPLRLADGDALRSKCENWVRKSVLHMRQRWDGTNE